MITCKFDGYNIPLDNVKSCFIKEDECIYTGMRLAVCTVEFVTENTEHRIVFKKDARTAYNCIVDAMKRQEQYNKIQREIEAVDKDLLDLNEQYMKKRQLKNQLHDSLNKINY